MSLRVQVLVFFMVLIYPICVPLARDRPKSFCACLPIGEVGVPILHGTPTLSGGNDVGVESKDPGLKALETIESPESVVSSLF